MTNSVLFEAFVDHRTFFIFNIFMNNSIFFAKTYVLPFPPPIIECVEALESIQSQGTVSCTTSSLWQREQCNTYFDKIWLFSCSNHIAVPSSTKFIINRAIPGLII